MTEKQLKERTKGLLARHKDWIEIKPGVCVPPEYAFHYKAMKKILSPSYLPPVSY